MSPMAQDAAGHAFGAERLQRVEMLAGADELDRHAGDVLDREQRAAAGVAVELRHDDAVELQRLVERLGAVHRVLAGHAVDDEEHLVRLHAACRCATSWSISSSSIASRPAVSRMTTAI